jgi:hypothetical protein
MRRFGALAVGVLLVTGAASAAESGGLWACFVVVPLAMLNGLAWIAFTEPNVQERDRHE